MANSPRAPLVLNTPQAAQIGASDLIPNLLLTTLAVVAAVIPQGQQLSQSAPQAKQILSVDESQHPLTLGFNPQPQIQRLDQWAPYPPYQVQVDQPLFHPLTLGMNPQPQIKQWDWPAPQPKYAVQVDVPPNRALLQGFNPQPQIKQLDISAPLPKYQTEPDVYPNLQGNTLKPAAVQNPFLPLDTSQIQGKYQVEADQYLNTLVLGYPLLLPSFAHWESAPFVPTIGAVDVYPNLSSLLGVPSKPVDTSQWQGKYQVQADVYPNVLVRGFNPQPQIKQATESAPPPKFAVQIDFYPNLLSSTLFVPPPPIPLPLGLPVDTSEWQGKFQVQVDAYPNILVLGYPAPPPSVKLDPWPPHWPMPPVSQAQLKKFIQSQRRAANRRTRQIAAQVQYDKELKVDIERAVKGEIPIEPVLERVTAKPLRKAEIDWNEVKGIVSKLLEKPLREAKIIEARIERDPEEDEISELNELHSLYARDFYERLEALQRLMRKKLN